MLNLFWTNQIIPRTACCHPFAYFCNFMAVVNQDHFMPELVCIQSPINVKIGKQTRMPGFRKQALKSEIPLKC